MEVLISDLYLKASGRCGMNKYIGFYELKSIELPAVQWRVFDNSAVLDPKLLWTVRVAVETGADLNLPRFVGVSAEVAQEEGRRLVNRFSERGIVVYYPYFIAVKSGVLEVAADKLIVEAVEKDLWNLVSHGHKNVTIIQIDGNYRYEGEKGFLEQKELQELELYAAVIKRRFRSELAEGLSVLAEWSYAYNTDAGHQPAGSPYLVFYELRTIQGQVLPNL